MGVESRRGESASLAGAIARFRPLRWITAPGTLEGGDVVRIGSTLFVGRSARSNDAGIAQLARGLAPLGYAVQTVEMRGCLHSGILSGNRARAGSRRPACARDRRLRIAESGGGSHLHEPDLQPAVSRFAYYVQRR
jgi:hypothetical protein